MKRSMLKLGAGIFLIMIGIGIRSYGNKPIGMTCQMINCPNTNACIERGGDINGCIITCHDGTPRFDCAHP